MGNVSMLLVQNRVYVESPPSDQSRNRGGISWEMYPMYSCPIRSDPESQFPPTYPL